MYRTCDKCKQLQNLRYDDLKVASVLKLVVYDAKLATMFLKNKDNSFFYRELASSYTVFYIAYLDVQALYLPMLWNSTLCSFIGFVLLEICEHRWNIVLHGPYLKYWVAKKYTITRSAPQWKTTLFYLFSHVIFLN